MGMRKRSKASILATATVVTTSMMLTSYLPAEAVVAVPKDQMDSVNAAIKAAGPAYVRAVEGPEGSVTAAVGPSTVKFPANSGGDITVDNVSIGIPGDDNLPAIEATDGSVTYGGSDKSSDTVVQTVPDGVRMLVVLKNESAPQEYRFPLNLPPGSAVDKAEDGSVLVTHPDEGLIANIDAPWAKDAGGQPVPTEYRLEGATVVQRSVQPRPRPSPSWRTLCGFPC